MTTVTDFVNAGELQPLRDALRGQYDIQRELGRGGMGIVVLARDERLDRQVALKVLPPALAAIPETRERFLREARMAAQLSHPNIVPVHRADDIGGFAFFAMGYVDGETLGDRIHARGALPAADVVRLLREVAWALAYAHARSIVHRDVKPENILIERSSGRAIVTDFGIARADYHPSITQDGNVLGTVHYMSPEQASGETLDGRSDLYSLGCVGFLALSGRLPFEGSSPQAVLIAHATKRPPLLREVAPSIPAPLANVIDQCLMKVPADRFATGEELADALGKAIGAIESYQGDAGASAVLSSNDAMAVWRRAAELQAEAASRIETRLREANETRKLAAVSTRAPAGGAVVAASADGTSVDERARVDVASSVPTDAYRVRDVEAAAMEVGISQRYVALAMAELQSSSAAVGMTKPASEFKERLATRLLGTSQRTLSVSRVIRFAPRAVLQAVGRTFQSSPYFLSLRETIGGHPLDGGVLVFDVPAMANSDYKWTWTRYGVYVPYVRATFASVAGDPRACEVTLHLDLRSGFTPSIAGYGVLAGVGSSLGGLAGGVVAFKALAIAGVALLGPIAGAAAVCGLGVLATAAPIYRWEIKKTIKELESALLAVEAGIRAFDIFGEAAPARPPTNNNDSLLGMGF